MPTCTRSALPEEDTVIVTADHGDCDRNQRETSPEDMIIPVAFTGGPFPFHYERTECSILDITPAIAQILGAEPDADWEGTRGFPKQSISDKVMIMYPKIYLAADNCVFYKRWTDPDDWAGKMKELGITYIEASADTELDPLYMGSAYLNDWIERVQNAEVKHGVKVCNLYSGHGTYTTLGLTHPDDCVRRNMVENWFYPMLRTAGALHCGMGFFAHAFHHAILQSAEQYGLYVDILAGQLAAINRYAETVGCGVLAIEQMYTPHQFPWRQQDIRSLLIRITQESGRDFYFTEDLGHHHIKFRRPTEAQFRSASGKGLWLGPDTAFQLAAAHGENAWPQVVAEMDKAPHLFADPTDCDCYASLKKLGCYSPIIHLQQTNGKQSSHLPFTEPENKKGIITAEKVLRALKESYDLPNYDGMPQKCHDIYLTLELFSGTTSIMQQVMDEYAQSVRYWRSYIPEDGLPLDQLLELLPL